ncbi:unnamed protein product [Prunus brigantina]
MDNIFLGIFLLFIQLRLLAFSFKHSFLHLLFSINLTTSNLRLQFVSYFQPLQWLTWITPLLMTILWILERKVVKTLSFTSQKMRKL